MTPRQISTVPQAIARLPHQDQDASHPAASPLYLPAVVLALLENQDQGKQPTVEAIAKTIKVLEARLTAQNQGNDHDRARVTQIIWEELHDRILLQVTAAVTNPGNLQVWLSLASQANREIDRCAKRVKATAPPPFRHSAAALQRQLESARYNQRLY